VTPRESLRDEVWFDDLYRANHGAVLAYARRRVNDPDDVVAEVFATAWRSRDRVPAPPLPWLYRTAGNHILHAYRAQGRRERLSVRAAELDTVAPDPADTVAARLDTSRRVEGALERLSAADRELLRLHAWEDLAHEQLAYVLGCSTATLRVRLRRARVRFAAHLDDLDAENVRAPRSLHATDQHAPTTEARP
jgi:RNA polymerase sigma-70 factor, ECF subfamily